LLVAVLWYFLFIHSAWPSTDSEVDRVEAAILHIVQKGLPSHGVEPFPGHEIARDQEMRRELAEAIVDAGPLRNIPPMLLVAMAFREGSFRNTAEGTIGERSTFQIVDQVIDALDCDVATYRGAADCAAVWLDLKRDECGGDLRGGFLRYATGRRVCRPYSEKTRWLVNDRFGIAEKLSKITANL
jgi:hypothetical protein